MNIWGNYITRSRKQEFELLYNTYSRQIYGFALRLSNGDSYLAEEVVQETFIRLWEHWDSLRDQQAALGYLFATAKHIFLNYCEHEMVKYVYEGYVMLHESEMSTEAENSQEAQSLEQYLKQVIANMPPMRQKVFVMSRFGNKTNKEIATELGISEKTVEVHITLALKELRNKLND